MSEARSSRGRSRRAASNAEPVRRRPLYARLLNLKHIHPSGVLCFFFFEGAVALAILLALAELVDWLAVGVLPLAIAAMVKVNDIIAGAGVPRTQPARPVHARSASGRVAAVSAPMVADFQDVPPVNNYDVTDEYDIVEEPVRPTRQRNEPVDGLDPAHRARQSAMYRYE